MKKTVLSIIGAGSLGIRLLGQTLKSREFEVATVVTAPEPWSLQRLRTFRQHYGENFKAIILDGSSIPKNIFGGSDLIVVATEGIGNKEHEPLRPQYARYPGKVVYGYLTPGAALVAPPFVAETREIDELFPAASSYHHGNCLISGLSPILGSLSPNLEKASAQVTMLPRHLTSYPTATKLHGFQFPRPEYVQRMERMLSLVGDCPLELHIRETAGLQFYLVDLAVSTKRLVTDIEKMFKPIPGVMWATGEEWRSTNDLYEYLVEPSLEIGCEPPQVIVYGKKGKGRSWFLSIALHHQTITPWSILRAVTTLNRKEGK